MSQHRFSLWWGPPKNFSERKNDRKVSWLELFYDLVYVAAISQLTHHLTQFPTWNVIAFSFLIFSLVFWSWVNGSQYYDLHGSDGIRTRLLTFWQMLSVAAVAITIEDVFEGHHQNFAIAFAVLQIIITYLWWSVGFYDPGHRIFSKFYTFNYCIAFCCFVVSAFLPAATATYLWILALALNLTPPLTAARTIVTVLKRRGEVFSASSALVERFGLFTIIVLAESILSTVTGISSNHQREVTDWLAFILGILISFLLWSIYFDMTSEQETKKRYRYLVLLIFIHYPLLAAMSITGASMKLLLSSPELELHQQLKWMFCIALAIILMSIVALTTIMRENEEDRSYIRPMSRLLMVAVIIIMGLPLFFKHLSSFLFLLLISLILLFPVFTGIKSWVRFKYKRDKR